MKFTDWHQEEHTLPEDTVVAWRPGAYAAIIKDNKLLCIKTNLNDFLMLPGGRIELKESIEQGLKGKVKSEIGINIEHDKHPYAVCQNFFYVKDNYFQALLFVFRAFAKETNFKLDPHVKEIVWVPREELNPNKFNPVIRDAIKKL